MPSPITSAQFVRLLDKRLREVSEGKYKEVPGMIDTFARRFPSDSAFEEFYSVGSLGDIPEFNGKISYLSISPGFYFKVEHKEYAAGIAFERKFLDDKKYSVLDNAAGKLGESSARTMEKLFVRVFVYADSTAYDFMSNVEENVALASSSHTTKSGTSTTSGFDNAGTSALSKTAVAATRLAMRGFRNDISERINMGDDLALVVPDALADTAYEIVGTQSGLYTAEGTKNVQYQRHEVIPYIRLDDYDTTDWYMVWKSQMKEDLLWIDRLSPEFKTTVDFETLQTKHSVYFRCSYGWKDWRWLYKNIV
jgi:hypothetical protein